MEAELAETTYNTISDTIAAPKIRVLLDARKLGDGGIGVYISNLIVGLVESGSVDLTLVVGPQASQQLRSDVGSQQYNILEDRAKKYSFDEMFGFTKRIDMKRYDLFHTPHYTLPFGVGIPTVVTVHDLIHITHPQRFFYPIIARTLIGSAIKRATKVITVSNASRSDLVRLNRRVQPKIEVIPNALNPELKVVEKLSDPTASKFGLADSEYIFTLLSNLKPHKGLSDLVWSFERLRREQPGIKLVVAGSGTAHRERCIGSIRPPSDLSDILFLGTVSVNELAQLYRGAMFYVMPSLAEGFGIPVVEAKYQGAPVVTRPVPAVKEIIESDDIVCADFSKESLLKGLKEGVKRFRRRNYLQPPLFNETRYSVHHTAQAVLSVYRAAINYHNRNNVSGGA